MSQFGVSVISLALYFLFLFSIHDKAAEAGGIGHTVTSGGSCSGCLCRAVSSTSCHRGTTGPLRSQLVIPDLGWLFTSPTGGGVSVFVCYLLTYLPSVLPWFYPSFRSSFIPPFLPSLPDFILLSRSLQLSYDRDIDRRRCPFYAYEHMVIRKLQIMCSDALQDYLFISFYSPMSTTHLYRTTEEAQYESCMSP